MLRKFKLAAYIDVITIDQANSVLSLQTIPLHHVRFGVGVDTGKIPTPRLVSLQSYWPDLGIRVIT